MYMQRTANRAFRDVPTYLVCAPLRSTSLSGCGRGVRLQLQTRAVACCLRASAQATPAPHAASVPAALTTCVLRPQISPHHRSLPTPRTGRTWIRSVRRSTRRWSSIGPCCWAPQAARQRSQMCQACAVRVRSRERCESQISVWSRPKGTGAGSRAVCRPGSAIVALVVLVSVPWLVVHGCDVPPGPFGLPVWTRDWAGPKITFHDRRFWDLLPI